MNSYRVGLSGLRVSLKKGVECSNTENEAGELTHPLEFRSWPNVSCQFPESAQRTKSFRQGSLTSSHPLGQLVAAANQFTVDEDLRYGL